MVLLNKKPPSSQNIQKPWWNKPLIGDLSLWERTNRWFYREEIPDSVLSIHQTAFEEATKLSRRAKSIDKEKFSNKEFLAFVRIRYASGQNKQLHQNLLKYTQLLQVGIDTKNAFIALEQIENKHQGKTFNEFYEYIDATLTKLSTPSAFQVYLQPKFKEVYPRLTSQEGKAALENYVRQLEKLAQHELGFKLLSAFKSHKFNDYSILRRVSDLIDSLNPHDLLDLKQLQVRVIAEQGIFDKLGIILGGAKNEMDINTFSKILQYIALKKKHEVSFSQFQELTVLLQSWYEKYKTVHSIREQYHSKRYKKVKMFAQPLPGVDLYNKYKDYFG
jgi:hypothetical protein